MGRIIMCGSFKGGVGKTVTAFNLAYSLDAIGKKVLAVDFVPSSMVFTAVDSKLRLEMGAEGMLSRILEPLRDDYEFILIDTCPSLGALMINALAVVDEVIITVNPQFLAIMELQDFLKAAGKIRNRINNRLSVSQACEGGDLRMKADTPKKRF